MTNRFVKLVLAVVVLAGLGAGGWAVFEHDDRAGLVKSSKQACGTLDTPDADVAVPAGMTLPAELRLLHVLTQGKTTVLVTSAEGSRGQIVEVRDRVVRELAQQGWRKKSTDQEPGYEAEAQLGGAGDASVRVRPLCQGRLEVRLTIRG